MRALVQRVKMASVSVEDEILGNIEKLRITEALRASNGMQRNAAKLLSVPPSTLNKKIAKYDINAEAYQGMSALESLRSRRVAS